MINEKINDANKAFSLLKEARRELVIRYEQANCEHIFTTHNSILEVCVLCMDTRYCTTN